MKLIIDIPNEVYDWHVNGFPDEEDAVRLLDIVKNGMPLTESEDCVSRQAVLDLPKNTERGFGGKILEQSINIEYIKALPPVTPAEKVGQSFEGMTNGEVMRTVFPHIRAFTNGFEGDMYGGMVDVYGIGIDDEDETIFSLKWWDSPYKGDAK